MRRQLPSSQSLIVFEAAARFGTFTRAAQELCLTQSAVSHQVLSLESALGVSLFRRLPRGLELTDDGARLLERIAPALDIIEATVREFERPGHEGGILNLGVVPTFASRWLIPRLPGFLRQHPGVRVNLAALLRPLDLAASPLDAAIHYGEPRWRGAECEYLAGEEHVVICAPALVEEERLARPADVLNFPLIRQIHRRDVWTSWLEIAGIENGHRYDAGPEYGLVAMVAEAVKAGLGLAILPRFMIEDDVRRGELAIPFDLPLRSSFAYYLLHPPHKAGFKPFLLMRQWLQQELASAQAAPEGESP